MYLLTSQCLDNNIVPNSYHVEKIHTFCVIMLGRRHENLQIHIWKYEIKKCDFSTIESHFSKCTNQKYMSKKTPILHRKIQQDSVWILKYIQMPIMHVDQLIWKHKKLTHVNIFLLIVFRFIRLVSSSKKNTPSEPNLKAIKIYIKHTIYI